MERKIFNSDDSKIKLSFDRFKHQYWQLRSASSIYSYCIPCVNFCGCITRPGFIRIYDTFNDVRIVPVCII